MKLSQREMLALLATMDDPGDDAQAWLVDQTRMDAKQAEEAKPACPRPDRKPVSLQAVMMILAFIAAIVSHLVKGD